MNFSGSSNIALNFWTAVIILKPLVVSFAPILDNVLLRSWLVIL